MINDNNANDNNYNNQKEKMTSSGSKILILINSFIQQIFQIRKTLRGVSISAIVLAPLAIALSVFLLRDPSFFAVLEIENEFGLVLSILLGAVIIVSSIWLITGIRQYRLIGSWNKRYKEYIKEKELIERKITSQYYDDYDDGLGLGESES